MSRKLRALRKVGENVTEILDYVPGRFEVIRHVRPAYAQRSPIGLAGPLLAPATKNGLRPLSTGLAFGHLECIGLGS